MWCEIMADSGEILDFWFKEVPAGRWFDSNPELDARIRSRFEETWKAARHETLRPENYGMRDALALILLFDQFPRNMFRGTALAFATDSLAREIARAVLARGLDLEAPAAARQFFYLPLMHSEDLADQELCVKLTRERLGEHHHSYLYALRHRDVIARFGRFPSRHAALGRKATPEESSFLEVNPYGL
jgi:uncharacterized protein (DUF924 family)